MFVLAMLRFVRTTSLDLPAFDYLHNAAFMLCK